MSWPAKFDGGRTIDTPVISLDILPTALDAVGVEPPSGSAVRRQEPAAAARPGKSTEHHKALYWSDGGTEGEWAVRQGDWKLHGLRDDRELFNLAADPSERSDLAAEHPERVAELSARFDDWLARDGRAPERWPEAMGSR